MESKINAIIANEPTNNEINTTSSNDIEANLKKIALVKTNIDPRKNLVFHHLLNVQVWDKVDIEVCADTARKQVLSDVTHRHILPTYHEKDHQFILEKLTHNDCVEVLDIYLDDDNIQNFHCSQYTDDLFSIEFSLCEINVLIMIELD